MKQYPRIYSALVEEHLRQYRQMVFLSGPRQVGKTTVSESVATNYLSWDDDGVRRAMKQGQSAVVEAYGFVITGLESFFQWRSSGFKTLIL